MKLPQWIQCLLRKHIWMYLQVKETDELARICEKCGHVERRIKMNI